MTDWVRFSDVKAHVSFYDVFAFYELLDAAEEGKNHELSIRCPFHDGAKRLLKAHTEKGVFKCFTPECDKQGNVIDFTAAMEGLSFRSAALFLQGIFMKPEEASDTEATTDVAEAVNEPRKMSSRGKPPDEVFEVVDIEVIEDPQTAAHRTPENPPQATTGNGKGKGYMREAEATLRDLLQEGDDDQTVKWVKAELYASYKRGQVNQAEGPRPRKKATNRGGK